MPRMKHLNPLNALRDLRRFLADRSRPELWFGILAIVVTFTLILGFLDNRGLEADYKRPEIVYVQDWPLDRSLEQIRRQNEVDGRARAERREELRLAQEKRKAEFRRVDDALSAWGL